ncbi:MAG: methyltransferase domain-containing protein [Elusimicrobiales bacterium]|jgi:cyclopropane fatty-acyl-phospholipid synthase-like methyltransferase|nr:methyltransferase domain-containing protein [Elusimicrobiales bacterium]
MSEVWDKKDYVDRYNDIYAPGEKELMAAADLLELNADDDLVDFGCGKGDFIASTLRLVRSVVGVDSSPHQIDEARRRFKNEPHVEILESAFLDFNPKGRAFTKGFSRKALHHLTDEEKKEFFARIGPGFAKGALFLVEDAIFNFPRAELDARWDRLMSDAADFYGGEWERKKEDVIRTFKDEFATGEPEWLEALEAGGFKKLRLERRASFYGLLLAQKK